jgi:ribosomal protein S18 acetylase RimI-like enzyme
MPTHSQTITLRPERPGDEAFLFALYASTRREELDAWGWPAEMRQVFLGIQFKASQSYRTTFPGAEFQIVLLDHVNAGRMVVHRSGEELRLVDLALLPEYRNAGVGSTLLRRILDEAAASQKPLRLNVLKGNRAERLYRRLGFEATGETGPYVEMEWRTQAGAPSGVGPATAGPGGSAKAG